MGTENLVGQVLGQYELRDFLGAGGMASVYRAYQLNLKRYVAIKVLPAYLASEPGYIERFNREAEIAASLEYAHIVPIYDYGAQRDITYVVMRLLDGGSLAQRLQQRVSEQRPLPSPRETGKLLRDLGGALDYAHKRGVIHRDIKPANIMFDNQGSAYLVDFGIARLMAATTSVTGTGVLMGTPAYMSPEQWQGRELTPAADQYALALVGYVMLTGRLPFEADTPYQLMHKHVNENPAPLQALRPELPPTLQPIFERALAKNPQERYPSVSAFGQEVEQVLNEITGDTTDFFHFPVRGKVLSATPSSKSAPTRPRRSRYASPLVWGISLLILAVLIGLVFALMELNATGDRANATLTQLAASGAGDATNASIVILNTREARDFTLTPEETDAPEASSTPRPTDDLTATAADQATQVALTVDARLLIIQTQRALTPSDTPPATDIESPTRTPAPTDTLAPTDTDAPTLTSTATPNSAATADARASEIALTVEARLLELQSQMITLEPSETSRPTDIPTDTPEPTATDTAEPTSTPQPTNTPQPTATDTAIPTEAPTRDLAATDAALSTSIALTVDARVSALETQRAITPSATPSPTLTPSNTPDTPATQTQQAQETVAAGVVSTQIVQTLQAQSIHQTQTAQARPTITPTPSATPTPTATWTPSPTPTDTDTPTPTATPETRFVLNNAIVRECAATSCDAIARYAQGQRVQVLRTEEGERVFNSDEWYVVLLANGDTAYMHSSTLSEPSSSQNTSPVRTTPRPTASGSSGNPGNSGGGATHTPAPAAGCNGGFSGTAASLFSYAGRRSASFSVSAGATITVGLSVSGGEGDWGIGVALLDGGGAVVASSAVFDESGSPSTGLSHTSASGGTYTVQVSGDSTHTYNYSVGWSCQ